MFKLPFLIFSCYRKIKSKIKLFTRNVLAQLLFYSKDLVLRLLINPQENFFTHEILEKSITKNGWKIGKHTYGHPKIIGSGRAHLEIGDYCSIADDVTLILANHNYRHISTYPFTNIFTDGQGQEQEQKVDLHAFSRGAIVIGNDVWIGQGATVFSGVRVGNGAAIGAGSYVREDVPDYAIVTGNPASVQRYRFSHSSISKLLELSWWDWDPDIVISNKEIFLLQETEFFSELEKRNLM